jgi:hypothetical protein
MRITYADPPYIGQARKHYRADPRCAEVDHAALIADLCAYDGWALSCSSSSLQQVLALCPGDVRIAAWVKPFAAFHVNVNPAYAWEPVLFSPARKRRPRSDTTVRDWLAESMTLKRGLVGVKPDAFSYWLFDLLGAKTGDEFVDLYPGSGAVSRAWQRWQLRLVS